MDRQNKKIILVGGGTMGSVSPLLAVAKKYPAKYLFVGSKQGPEREVVRQTGLDYTAIRAGKLRRYWSVKNILDIANTKIGFFQSLKIIKDFKPDIILSAGSFVAVPMIIAAWLLRIPRVIHQQDIKLGLANKLMSYFTTKVTVTFPEQVKLFAKEKTIVTGNPVRSIEENKPEPIILITGGGLGARSFNDFISEFIPYLAEHYPVHHILGKDNGDQALDLLNYYPHKFVTEDMLSLIARAEIIISRAGMSLITEAASMSKALVLIPIPDSHQEANAEFFAKNNSAILVKQGSAKIMSRYLHKLLSHSTLRQQLGDNLNKLFPTKPIDNYRKVIEDILNKRK